jgi:hypothetical protein
MKIQRINNTLFFVSSEKNVLGYYVIKFRKRNNITKLSVLRQLWRKARELEEKLPVKSSSYIRIVEDAKRIVYSNRIDAERELTSVIHPILQVGEYSLLESWDMLFNGLGNSVYTGLPLKVITCKEKRIKALKVIVDLLDQQFNQ